MTHISQEELLNILSQDNAGALIEGIKEHIEKGEVYSLTLFEDQPTLIKDVESLDKFIKGLKFVSFYPG